MSDEPKTPAAAPAPATPAETPSPKEIPSRPPIAQSDKDGAPTVRLADDKYWSKVDQTERSKYIDLVDEFYFALVDEFLHSSNRCVDNHKEATKSYLWWRWLMIWLTGTLAMGNVILAYSTASDNPTALWKFMKASLPLIVAVYAALIVIFANLHSLYNHFERAQGFREARELFLDAYRDYEMKWQTQVKPFGSRSAACVNAGILYERIVAHDRELRGRAKELTKQSGREGGATAGAET